MTFQRKILVLLAAFLVAGSSAADTKVVKKVHQDGFSAMGQEQKARDYEQVLWVGEGRLRMNQENSSSIIRADLKKLFILYHDRKAYYDIDLPVNLDEMLPPGMGQHLMQMMNMEVTITPSEEMRKVGSWQARRYDMEMSSAMMNMKTVIWASQDTGIETKKFRDMYGEMLAIQPGMSELVEKMKEIDGFVVAQESSMTMPMLGEVEVAGFETTVSIEEATAPTGTYDAPSDYAVEEFDFTKLMQGQ